MTQENSQIWSVEQPVRKDYLVFGSPQILEPEIEEVVATLRSGWAEWISDRTLSLPLSPKLTDADVDDVILAMRRTLEHFTP